jgi:signal transduction histidine kinase
VSRPLLRTRSLRTSALLVFLAIVASPLVFVLVSNGVESFFVGRTLERAVAVRDEAAAELRALPSGADVRTASAAIDALALQRDQRIRVVTTDGVVAVDCDHLVGHGWLFGLGDLVYGPDRVPVLTDIDGTRGPLASRGEVVDAFARGHAERCVDSARGNLEVCDAAATVSLANGGDVVVHVEGSSRRALGALYASRRQLLKLTFFVLALALVLWWWMGRRMVQPVEALRDDMLARARAVAPRAEELSTRGRRDEIGHLEAAFDALMTALAERSRANEAFVADLAHELKNPVASVRACAERLVAEEAIDPARAHRLGEALRTSAGRLDALATQFLELARAEGGLPGEKREPMDLGALARGLGRTAAEATGASIDVSVDDGEAVVTTGVASRMESLLRNLIDNATSFAGEAGHVRIEVRRAEGEAVVIVSDDGPGIAAEDLPRVFDRFFTTRGDRRGTGLGLALARAVVEAHAGTIRAESPVGGGARFVVRLPRTFTPL